MNSEFEESLNELQRQSSNDDVEIQGYKEQIRVLEEKIRRRREAKAKGPQNAASKIYEKIMMNHSEQQSQIKNTQQSYMEPEDIAKRIADKIQMNPPEEQKEESKIVYSSRESSFEITNDELCDLIVKNKNVKADPSSLFEKITQSQYIPAQPIPQPNGFDKKLLQELIQPPPLVKQELNLETMTPEQKMQKLAEIQIRKKQIEENLLSKQDQAALIRQKILEIKKQQSNEDVILIKSEKPAPAIKAQMKERIQQMKQMKQIPMDKPQALCVMEKIQNQELVKYQKQDVELETYLTQKYLKADAGGLIGKVFRKMEVNMPGQDSKTGRWKCPICCIQFATGHGLWRHKRNKICEKRADPSFTYKTPCKQGMNPVKHINKHHSQAKRMDELIWGDQLLIHKEMSLAKINYEYSKMMGSVISVNFDPFDTKLLLSSEMEVFVLGRVMEKMGKLLLSKVLSHHYQIPWSEVTMLHTTNPEIVEEIEDSRSVPLILGGDYSNVFVTPNFIQNFDLIGGYDKQVLDSKVFFAAIQVGIYLLDEFDQNQKTLDVYQTQNLERQRLRFGEDIPQSQFEYRCFFGVRLDPNSLYDFMNDCYREDEHYMDIFKENYECQYNDKYEFARCPFFVRYKRINPDDQASPFILSDFDLTHTHPLGFHEIHYSDLNSLSSRLRPSASIKADDFRQQKREEIQAIVRRRKLDPLPEPSFRQQFEAIIKNVKNEDELVRNSSAQSDVI